MYQKSDILSVPRVACIRGSHLNETMTCMRRHASVRQYRDRDIDSDMLDQLIRCGQAASSSSFIQAYSVIRVIDPKNREVIANAAGGQQWIIDAAEFLVFCADLKRINYCCEKEGQGELHGHTEHFITATVDTALMAQNVLLAAESAGLGGVFIGGIRNDPQTISDCLGLPNRVYPVFGLCLGWPLEHPPESKPRLPLDSVLHQDRYQQEQEARQVEAYDAIMQRYYRERSANARITNWSRQTARAVQGKLREHMLGFLQQRGFLQR